MWREESLAKDLSHIDRKLSFFKKHFNNAVQESKHLFSHLERYLKCKSAKNVFSFVVQIYCLCNVVLKEVSVFLGLSICLVKSVFEASAENRQEIFS